MGRPSDSEVGEAAAELRRQREEIQRTATTLDVVVRQVSAMWWLVDRDMRITRTGGAIEANLGYPPDHNLGKTMREVVDSDDDPSIDAHRRALAGETVSYASEYLGKMFELTIAPYRVDDEIVGAVGTSVNVTPIRMLERRMVDAQRAESLGVLAGGLAHDFNNLLVAILGNADLGLRDAQPGTPVFSALENIRDASLRAAELTNQLLAYAGRGGIEPARVELQPLVSELLRISASRVPPNVSITVDIPRDLTLHGDIAQVRQVVLNLVGNATDAVLGRGGHIAISATLARRDGTPGEDDVLTPPSGSYVALTVRDDGIGMDTDTRRRVFEPFFTTKPQGHGLGLAATLGIMRAHHGGLELCTSPGSGATFRVLWRASVTPLAIAATTPPTRNVLVIDDEGLVRDVVARMVEDLGYSAITAADGRSGIETLERGGIDAVLVDLTMPLMSGAEVITEARRIAPGIPIVLCSGFDREGRGPVKADAYLPKPFRIDALQLVLQKVLP